MKIHSINKLFANYITDYYLISLIVSSCILPPNWVEHLGNSQEEEEKKEEEKRKKRKKNKNANNKQKHCLWCHKTKNRKREDKEQEKEGKKEEKGNLCSH